MMGENEKFDPSDYRDILDEFHADVRGEITEEQRSSSVEILKLLAGYFQIGSDGLPQRIYLADGSDEEIQARSTFARLLRSGNPIPTEIRGALASLFDPISSYLAFERKIVFSFRNRGARTNVERDFKIALAVYDLVRNGETVDAAAYEVSDKYALHEKHVMRIWGKYKSLCAVAREPIRE